MAQIANREARAAAAEVRGRLANRRATLNRQTVHAMRAAVPGMTEDSSFASSDPIARMIAFPGELQIRDSLVERNGAKYRRLDGVASATEQPYEMYDFFGPYIEVMDAEAFDSTLGRDPDVAFLLNHRGLTMARSLGRPGEEPTLVLSADERGLVTEAYVNPKRSDVHDMLVAIQDGNVTEMSFAFMIVRGIWSPDYSEYRIKEVDLHRGDVSAVNYGANPYTSIGARSGEVLEDFLRLPRAAQLAACERAGLSLRMATEDAREDITPVVNIEVNGDADPEKVAEVVRDVLQPPAESEQPETIEAAAERLAASTPEPQGMSMQMARARFSVLCGDE